MRQWQRRRMLQAALAAAAGLGARSGAASPAVPVELSQGLPAARLQGQGTLRFLGLRIYEARLWVGAQTLAPSWSDAPAVPLALELHYARAFRSEAIAARSLQEMRRQGPIEPAQAARWQATMQRLFPDVQSGDRLTGLWRPDRGAEFFFNGRATGEVGEATEPGFARRFFGVWLSEQTSEPALRAALLQGASRPTP